MYIVDKFVTVLHDTGIIYIATTWNILKFHKNICHSLYLHISNVKKMRNKQSKWKNI